MTPTAAKAQAWSDAYHAKLSSSTIPGLDGVRALAVGIVIVSHFGLHNFNGGLGVLIFFVLSGFLITWLMLREVDKTGTVSLKNFYARRTLRIFPAFYAFLFAMVAIYLVRGHYIHWGATIASFFYLNNYYMALVPTGFDAVGHCWSLSIEEQFYLLWPFLFLRGRGDLRRLSKLLAGVIVLVWVHRAVLVLVFDVRQEYLYRAFDTRMDHLAIGCLMAILLKRRAIDGFVRSVCARGWYPLLTLAALFGLQFLHHNHVFTFVFGYAIEPLLTAMFLIQLIGWSQGGAWRIFEHPVTRYLGRISYPLYLWQQLTLYTGRRLTADMPLIVQVVFAVGVTIAFASASYYFVEKPFLRLKKRY